MIFWHQTFIQWLKDGNIRKIVINESCRKKDVSLFITPFTKFGNNE